MRDMMPLLLMPTSSPFPLAVVARDLDYFEIVTHAGPVVMGVLVLLILASVISWAIILKKWLHLRRAQDESVKFLETFWQSKRLDAIYQAAESLSASPISQVFRAGYVELSKSRPRRRRTAMTP